jgi:hypothetical protein
MENDSRKSCEPPSALETVARIDAHKCPEVMELALKKVFGKSRGKVGKIVQMFGGEVAW